MKRKVNLVGQSTLTVSLPSKWVKQQGLNKGDEIDVVEDGSTLALSAGSQKKHHLKTKIKLHGSWKLKRRYLFSAYKKGFDEVHVTFQEPTDLQRVQEYLESLIGFEIVEQGKDYCVVKSIALPSYEEFDNILRKYFLVLLNMADGTYEALRDKDVEHLQNIVVQDLIINKLCNFIGRALGQKGDSLGYPATFLYPVIVGIESIGDLYRDLCKAYAANGASPGTASLLFLKDANTILRNFYDFFYTFEPGKAELFMDSVSVLEEKGLFLLKKLKGDDLLLVHYILAMAHALYNLNSPVFTTHMDL